MKNSIKNVSYRNRKTLEEIEGLVGKPYSFIERIKMNGIGSPRLKVLGASQNIMELLEKDNYINYCHVEIRPDGIIVGFRSKLESYSWCIPFYKLYTSQNGRGYRIYSDTEHVLIQSGKNNTASFFRKLMNYKSRYLNNEKLT